MWVRPMKDSKLQLVKNESVMPNVKLSSMLKMMDDTDKMMSENK
jgi:hypothetical protein